MSGKKQNGATKLKKGIKNARFWIKDHRGTIGLAVTLIAAVVTIVVCIMLTDCGQMNKDSGVSAYLPDALGGFLGVIFGFFIEFSCVQAIRRRKQFVALVNILKVELNNYLKDRQEMNPEKDYKLVFPILEDVMDSAENIALFKMDELQALREINLKYLEYNNDLALKIERGINFDKEAKLTKLEGKIMNFLACPRIMRIREKQLKMGELDDGNGNGNGNSI